MKLFSILASFALLALVAGCELESTPTKPQKSRASRPAPAPGTKSQYVVYDFWAPWCKPCLEFAPTFEQWEKKYAKENVVFQRVNVDQDQMLARKFQINAIPTIIVTADGEEIGRFVGNAKENEAEIANLLK